MVDVTLYRSLWNGCYYLQIRHRWEEPSVDYRLNYTAEQLCKDHWADLCPFYILADRMQEYPQELEASDEEQEWKEAEIIAAVEWIRTHKPHWFEVSSE